MNTPQPVRLQKVLAAAGVASRRGAEALIQAGRVSVNGEPITAMGVRVDPATDTIEVDGKRIKQPPRGRTLMLNKPQGYICSTNEEQGRTIYQLLPDDARLVPVGRLDKLSEGLLLLTADGELANQLMHPRYEHEKCYQVHVAGGVAPAMLDTLNRPMTIDGYRIRPCTVELLAQRNDEFLLRFVLREGRNRQIRRMCEEVGLQVTRLIRVSYAGVDLGDLPQGQWRELRQEELQQLRS